MRLFFTILITAAYSLLLLNNRWGFGFVVLNLLYLYSFFTLHTKLFRKELYFYAISSLVLCLFISFRAFEPGRHIVFLSVFVLNSLLSLRAGSSQDTQLTLKMLVTSPFVMVARSLLQLGNLGEVFSNHKIVFEKMSNVIGKTISSILLTFILGSLFLVLFSNADPVFNHYAIRLFKLIPQFNISIQTIFNIVQIMLVFVLSSSFLSVEKTASDEIEFDLYIRKISTPVTAATVTLSIITGLFLIVQAQYLFAGDELLKSFNISHSEYTRRGFFELVVVSSISLGLVWFSISAIKRTIAYIFIFEIAALLASAFWRDWLYQASFGFTQARILGFLVAVWLSGTLVLFFGVLKGVLKEKKLIFALLANSVWTIFLMEAINVDRLVAVVKKPNLGYQVDYVYPTSYFVSSDAWEGWNDSLVFGMSHKDCDQESIMISQNLLEKTRYLELLNSQRGLSRIGSWVYSDKKSL